jgi:hypothetical protein
VALTYPTKHYHWFFADWPFMWVPNGLGGAGAGNVDAYWNNVWDYRGDNAIGEQDVEHSKNTSGLTIAGWFLKQWKNGLVAVGSRVWDMEQNTPKGPPGGVPPGSPYRPTVEQDKFVPHETNLISVGEETDHTGIGLGDANYLLAAATDTGAFNTGHFNLSTSYLINGERAMGLKYEVPVINDDSRCLNAPTNGSIEASGDDMKHPIVCVDSGFHGIYSNPHADWYGEGYPLPPIGLVSYLHAYAGQGLITRSNMAEWHYRTETLLMVPKVLRYIDWIIEDNR